MRATISDLADPLHDWESIASDIRRGYVENFNPPLKLNSAQDQDQYLGKDDFLTVICLDPRQYL